ncbi:MAG: 50S ribosomal protein L5 [Thermoprotei archaeon]|nr:MAG: 50S ribosomal protein L5 [Thermoprotei archaeon]RLF01101.1 MAG: 50S ribosomal protein L5 [Thermoprotei archaeon]
MLEKPWVLPKEHPMRSIVLGKVVVNMAVGESGERLMKAAMVLEEITGQKPSFRKAKRTIKEFGIKRGENIACIVTLRGEKALKFLEKVLPVIDYKIKESGVDKRGNICFGIKEHIHLPGVKYDPTVGIFGFDVCISLERPGFRVARRKRRKSSIGKNHFVTREEAIEFLEKVLGVAVIKTTRR